ncbi:MAG: hydroxyacylglutathione hydrolase [Deltaproteobacteria bacterium]
MPVPVLQDNYSYLIMPEDEAIAAVVDCVEVESILAAAAGLGVKVTAILSTHHHWDHTAGNEEMAAREKVRIFGNADDAERIPGLTDGVREGDSVVLGSLVAEVLRIPAHTSGHIAYYFRDQKSLFTGDTLFVAGCGRLFEGDASQMMASLGKLDALAGDTRVFCGHEYTVKNLEFAAELEPKNKAIRDKLAWSRARRREGMPTVPSTLASERETNPFLRVGNSELRETLEHRCPGTPPDDASVFAAVRRLKDDF